MSGALQIGLRAGEKLYINGAVVRVDRKVRIELLNDATFLLGSHVMQLSDATTPLRQIYFLTQGLLMDPSVRGQLVPAIDAAIASVLSANPDASICQGLDAASRHVRAGNPFDALKALRGLLAGEAAAVATSAPASQPVSVPATIPAHCENAAAPGFRRAQQVKKEVA